MIPKYEAIAADIRRSIEDGALKPGDKLPTVVEFCELYSVSKITVKRAIEQITEEGLITSRRGSGTYVKDTAGLPGQAFFQGKNDRAQGFSYEHRGEKVTSVVYDFSIVNPPADIAAQLGIAEDDFAYHVVRVRQADEKPIVIEYTYMPLELIPGLKKKDLYGSLYRFIREQCGLKISSFHRTIRAVAATEEEAERLDTKPGSPLLELTQIGFLDSGAAFEYSVSRNVGIGFCSHAGARFEQFYAAPTQHNGSMNTSDLIKLTPIFHEKIWGGRQLETVFGYDIPEGPIGECWAISAHPNGDCQIAEGPYAGHTLSWLWAEHRELFGNCEGKEFPLLIKILDAKDDLSIQIHPNDEYAAKHENGSLGKTECWYVLDCEPGATIIVGQRAHDRAEAAQMIEEGRWGDMLNVLPIHKGDFFQIDSGTVHAIKTGTLILETQQSSDVTYRLYDYDRPGTDGKLRPLHIEQSLDCIDFGAQAPTDGTVTAPEVDGVTELESNPCYTVDRVRVDGSKTLDQRWPFMCLSIIDGEGTVCGDPVHKGSHLLAPSTVDKIELEGNMELIISHL